MTYWDCFVHWLDKWQTLITGALALGAAFYAGRPVYRQLALMRAQNNVMVRETIGDMILQLDTHRNRVGEITAKRLTDVHSAIYRFDNYGETKGIDEWASQQHSEFIGADSELKALFIQSHDVEAIEVQKAALLAAVDAFSGVLWDIYAPHYAFMFPEDCNWSDAEHASAVARSSEAEKELDSNASAVSAAVRQLYEAYAEQRAGLVRRLRVIDDGLLA
ncbi:hypothetical protein [Sphingobium baderi]|uniref:Uncharacterized protein n=1 Tax=Sphingobium baderi TaxID=1332080 RepID=A0A0S3F2I8_9SPHN|nr:hypothetical protein [Sphingobium baderi]ALR21884.1 hypothetical protein ATN00_17900 [Sphingobium baderi]